MTLYQIPVSWEVCDYVQVEAESLEQAIILAEDCELPDDPQYIAGSFEVNVGFIEELEPTHWIVTPQQEEN